MMVDPLSVLGAAISVTSLIIIELTDECIKGLEKWSVLNASVLARISSGSNVVDRASLWVCMISCVYKPDQYLNPIRDDVLLQPAMARAAGVAAYLPRQLMVPSG